MTIGNVRLVDTDAVVSIGMADGKITGLSADGSNKPTFTFNDAIAFPGLINSHDHLDFNNFPQLGDKIYHNYVEWGEHIQDNYKAEIDAVLNIPIALRSQWGIYKNLLCGITTVVNHGEKLHINDPLITVFDSCQSLHSVMLEKNWKLRLNNPLKANIPTVIHVGEGSDIGSFTEINALLRWSFIKRDMVAVHGVAMKASQAANFKALVWCPQTNYFLLNKTADISTLKKCTTILFGTDSTLTSTWDAWDHIRMARKTDMMDDAELFYSLTVDPAEIWKLNCGKLAAGKDADMVIARDKVSFFNTEPTDILMVVHKGNIRLFDEEMYGQVVDAGIDITAYSKIYIGESCKYIQGDLPALMKEIRKYQPEAKFPVKENQPELVHAH